MHFQESDDSNCDGIEAECMFCHIIFKDDRSGDKWAQCEGCLEWAHVHCAGNDMPNYICDFCRRF